MILETFRGYWIHMLHKLPLFFFLLAISFVANALNETKIDTELNQNPCEYETVINEIYDQSLRNEIELYDLQKKTLEGLDKILSNVKTKNSNQPLIEILRPEDLDEFNELSQKSVQLNMALLVESEKLRDLEIISKMIEIVKTEYYLNKKPAQGTNDEWLYMLLNEFTDNQIKDIMTEPLASGCSLDSSLFDLQLNTYQQSDFKNAHTITPLIESLRNKYNAKTIDKQLVSKMSKEDKVVYNNLKTSLKKMNRELTFITRIESIRILLKASDLIYNSSQKDLTISAGDTKSMGTTINNFLKKNDCTQTKLAITFWSLTNDKFPCEMMRMLSSIAAKNENRASHKQT